MIGLETDFRKGLKWSFGLHVGLALFVAIKGIFAPDVKPYVPTLRVDVVALPDLLKSEKMNRARKKAKKEKAPPPKVAKKEKKKKAKPKPKKDEMAIRKKTKKRSSRMQSALSRIKAIAKVESETTTEAPVKGNILSKGSSTSEDAKETGTETYYDAVLESVKQKWTLPVWLSRQPLSAQVLVFVDKRGRLQRLSFVKFSGNAQFDDAVRKAVSRAQPFPAPPENLISSLLSDGILLGFPL